MAHRGATAADARTSDGSGLAIPLSAGSCVERIAAWHVAAAGVRAAGDRDGLPARAPRRPGARRWA